MSVRSYMRLIVTWFSNKIVLEMLKLCEIVTEVDLFYLTSICMWILQCSFIRKIEKRESEKVREGKFR